MWETNLAIALAKENVFTLLPSGTWSTNEVYSFDYRGQYQRDTDITQLSLRRPLSLWKTYNPTSLFTAPTRQKEHVYVTMPWTLLPHWNLYQPESPLVRHRWHICISTTTSQVDQILKMLLAKRLECSPMARKTWVQSQVESYQRLKKWYLMLPCLTLSIIRYESRVKWRNPGKGVAPSPTPWCSSYGKEESSGHPRLWSPTFTYYLLSISSYRRRS